MRHRKKTTRLGMMSAHRKATMMNMARALFQRESIRTTKTKAKVVQSYAEKIITTAKVNTPESKRKVFALLRDKGLIDVLFNDIAPRFKTRKGGYTRVIPLYPRPGDGAPMALLELVEKKPKAVKKKEEKSKAKEKAEPKVKKAAQSDSKAVLEKPGAKEDPKKETKAAPVPKADLKEDIRKEKARDEDKKIQKRGMFKNIRKYFRRKSA